MNSQQTPSRDQHSEPAGLFSDPEMTHAILKNIGYLFIYLIGLFLVVKIFH
jgi:hypothetical protein